MYVQEKCLEKYEKLINSKKLEGMSYEQVLYKIRKSVELGKHVYTCKDGAKLIQYFNLVFKVENFRCVKVYRDACNHPYIVDKELKKKYDEEFLIENGYCSNIA